MTFKYSVRQIFLSLWKRPWLLLGTALLIFAWRWENFSVKDYQQKLEIARRKYEDYAKAIIYLKLTEMETKQMQALRNHDSTSISEFELSTSYADLIISEQSLIYAGQILNEGFGAREIGDSLVYMRDNLPKLSFKQLTDFSKSKLNEAVSASDSDQFVYNDYVIGLDKRLSRSENWQIVLFVAGVIIIALDRGISNLKKEESELEIVKNLKALPKRKL